MEVLITGGNGLLGRHLVVALQGRGDSVRVLALPEDDIRWLRQRGVAVHRGDVRQPDSLVAPMSGVAAVIHLASMIGVWRSLDEYRAVNVAGTRNVCWAALAEGVRRVVHVSSWMVYGLDLGQPVREDFLLRPFHASSAITKAEGDLIVQRMIADDHLPAVIVRPGEFFGPGDWLTFRRIADRLRVGKWVIVGSGDNVMPFVYVTDVVYGLLLALNSDYAVGQAYNLSNDSPVTQQKLLEVIAHDIGVSPPTVHIPYRALYTAAYAAEHLAMLASPHRAPRLTRLGVALFGTDNRHAIDKARRELGYTPQVTIRDGIRLTAAWYLNEGRPNAYSGSYFLGTASSNELLMKSTRWVIGKGRLATPLLPLIIAVGLLTGCSSPAESGMRNFRITDYTQFVDNNQGPGQVFMRYPLGRLGLWSTPRGEIADSVTRGLLLYPTVDQVVDKGTADWRASITASPSQTTITYSPSVAAKGSAAALTVTPDVSLYRYHFTSAASYEAVDLLMQEVENPSVTWSRSTFVYVNRQTAEVTLSNGENRTCYFYIKFSSPAAGHGTFTSSAVTRGANSITGDGIGGYLTFRPGTPVTVAVALSMTSMPRAEQNFIREFPAFDFAGAVQNLKSAWNAKLGKIDVQSASTLTAQEIYTGLYTLYANIIDVTDNGSGYAPVAPSTRLLTIGSSIWWERVGGGYFRCSFDQGRNVYAFLTLLDPAVMRDVLNTYLSQYNHDGFLMGNWDPYTPDAWADQQWGFFGYFFLAARLGGVTGVDYHRAETAILATMGMNATSMYLVREDYYKYGYVPADIGTVNYLSRGLEFATQLQGLAHLGYVLGDRATYHAYYPWGEAYLRTWNRASKIFQARNTDGTWAPANAGLFEGVTANYAFDEPQDGLGLARIYGDRTMSVKIASIYAVPDTWYNDYQLVQPYLAISANSPWVSQDVIRNYFLPEFRSLSIWENLPGDGSLYYTDNASAEVLANLGIYPIQSPGAQWILNSPAVVRAVIHGQQDTTIQAPGNSLSRPYVSSIRVNGSAYPSQFISGETLAAQSNTVSFGMTGAPSRIGRVYITGTNGEVLSASADNGTYLRFRNDPLGGTSEAEVYAGAAPSGVSVNGAALPGSDWSYNSGEHLITLKGLSAGMVLLRFIPHSPRLPLGAAVMGKKAGGKATYSMPNGRANSVEILDAVPYVGA